MRTMNIIMVSCIFLSLAILSSPGMLQLVCLLVAIVLFFAGLIEFIWHHEIWMFIERHFPVNDDGWPPVKGDWPPTDTRYKETKDEPDDGSAE